MHEWNTAPGGREHHRPRCCNAQAKQPQHLQLAPPPAPLSTLAVPSCSCVRNLASFACGRKYKNAKADAVGFQEQANSSTVVCSQAQTSASLQLTRSNPRWYSVALFF